MFDMGTPAWGIVVRSIAVYGAVFVGLRLMGKRELGQMTVFDLVVILLIANAVQNAMVGPDASLQGGILAAVVLLVMNHLVAVFRLHGGRFGRLIEGTPTVLVEDGRYVEPHLRKQGIEHDEVEMAAREHGLESVNEVKLAVLEVDGSISIVPAGSEVLKSRKHVRQLRKH
jgi:uncharacterized membrane protein YcaP (DUF421 family)